MQPTTKTDSPQWTEPLGHGDVLRGLARAAHAQRLPHALLFEGLAGTGKFLAANRLALGLLCERGDVAAPCGACGSCRRVMGAAHGDLLVIDVLDDPAKDRREELTIGRVVRRDESPDGPTIEEFFGLRAREGGWRIAIVREAERMNSEAQNALLKTLEEPPENALMILESSQPASLLPTIRSRCVRVQFAALEADVVAAVLLEHGVAPERAALTARWAAGSPGRALALARNGAPELREFLAGLLLGQASAFETARAVWELEGDFEGKTAKAIERARLRFVLDFWLAVLADLSAVGAGRTRERAAHGDLVAAWMQGELARNPAAARRAIETLLALRADIDDNIDPPTVLDRACLALAPRAARSGATKTT